jgi:hypothetical protein
LNPPPGAVSDERWREYVERYYAERRRGGACGEESDETNDLDNE